MEHLAHSLTQFIDRDGYAALFVVMVLGNIGLPIGAEVVIPVAGGFAAAGHLSSVWIAALVVLGGEVTGQGILYAVGYYGGRPFVERWGKYLALSLHKLDVAHAYYERYGSTTVFLCRFVPFVRGVAGLPAGISRMALLPFLAYTIAGSAIFCLGLIALGNALGSHLGEVLPTMRAAGFGLFGLAAAAIAVLAIRRRRAGRRAAAEHARI